MFHDLLINIWLYLSISEVLLGIRDCVNQNTERTMTRINTDINPFLNCKQMLNYKLNLQSRIEHKC